MPLVAAPVAVTVPSPPPPPPVAPVVPFPDAASQSAAENAEPCGAVSGRSVLVQLHLAKSVQASPPRHPVSHSAVQQDADDVVRASDSEDEQNILELAGQVSGLRAREIAREVAHTGMQRHWEPQHGVRGARACNLRSSPREEEGRVPVATPVKTTVPTPPPPSPPPFVALVPPTPAVATSLCPKPLTPMQPFRGLRSIPQATSACTAPVLADIGRACIASGGVVPVEVVAGRSEEATGGDMGAWESLRWATNRAILCALDQGPPPCSAGGMPSS